MTVSICVYTPFVIPAQAGIQRINASDVPLNQNMKTLSLLRFNTSININYPVFERSWIPACAGMTLFV